MRPAWLIALTLGIIGVGCRADNPDVILITLDTTRADHLGAYGYERPISPELDAFARESVTYRHAWSTDSWTLPAHASIFTGQYPTRHGAHFDASAGAHSLGEVLPGERRESLRVNVLQENATTLAELLAARGYLTAAVVGGPWMSPAFGLLQGYAVQDARVRSVRGRRADELTRAAVAWLETVPPERRIHLMVNYFDPHYPYDPPRGFDTLPHARERVGVAPFEVLGGAKLTPEDRARFIARYDGEIGFMDHHFGSLMTALRRLRRYDGALIIVVGDHGETFGEHGFMEHGRWLYEDVLHVPLLIHYPRGRDAGTVVGSPVSVADLLPLIAGETGLRIRSVVDGLPIGRRRLVVAESFRDGFLITALGARFDRDLTAAIRWPWKLIVSSRGTSELYRLDDDPGELRDLSQQATGRTRKLDAALQAARRGIRPPARQAPAGVDDATRDALRALGYIQ